MFGSQQRLAFRFLSWYFLVNGLFFCCLGYSYLKNILLCPSLFNNLAVHYDSVFAKVFIVLFWVMNYLSYMMVLAFIPAVLLFLLAFLFPVKRLLLPLSILLASLSLVLLQVNNAVFSSFKFHLNTTVIRIFLQPQWVDAFDLSASELQWFALLFFLIVLVQALIAHFIWKKNEKTEASSWLPTLGRIWLVAFIWGYLTLVLSIYQGNSLFSQQTPKLPWYNQLIVYLIPDKNAEKHLLRNSEMSFAQPLFSEKTMRYPLHPLNCHKPENPPNIILLMVDSLRFDSLQPQYMPHLSRWAEGKWQFLNHQSGGNATQPGLFSLFYSLPANYWTAALQQKIPPEFIKLLQQYQYTSKILWSNEMANPPFDKTIYLGLDSLSKRAHSNDIGANDRRVTDKALTFLRREGSRGPFFLNIFYDAVHGWCREQSFPTPRQPTVKHCVRMSAGPTDPKLFYNRYLNAVGFVDAELGKLLAFIEQQGYLNNSLVIITSDHGEEFNDSGQEYWGHASNFTPTQVHIPLLIHWPGQAPQVITHLTSSYDLVPTLLRRVFHCENPRKDYSIGQDLLQPAGRFPFVITGSYNHMGFVETDRITTLRASGTIAVANSKAEPMVGIKPDMAKLGKALELMQRYYEGKGRI